MNSLLSIEYKHYTSLNDLDSEDIKLVEKMYDICDTSFSPYSSFRVGAVALLDSGEVVWATNQESEVYPSGMCAERSLLYYLMSHYIDNKILTMVVGSPDATQPCTPCGSCRQVIIDAEKRQNSPIRMLMVGAGECIEVAQSNFLLPFAFKL